MPTQPSFSERRERMATISNEIASMSRSLKSFAEAIYEEAIRMKAAEKRFAERRGQNDKRRAR